MYTSHLDSYGELDCHNIHGFWEPLLYGFMPRQDSITTKFATASNDFFNGNSNSVIKYPYIDGVQINKLGKGTVLEIWGVKYENQ